MSGFEKHMADVLRDHEVAPPAGLDTQVFAALDGAGASAARSAMRRRLGGAGIGALLLAGLGWSISTMTPEGGPAAAGPAAVQNEVLTPEVAPVEIAETPAPFEEATADVEPRAVEAKSEDRMQESATAAVSTPEPVDLTPLEQLSVQGVDDDAASDKSLQEASAERDGVWRMNARVNVKED